MKSSDRPIFKSGTSFMACRIFFSILFLTISGTATSPEKATGFSSVMGPGMTFSNFILVLDPAGDGENQILRATKAEIRDISRWLHITNLRVCCGKDVGKFELDAPAAVYDFTEKSILIQNGFSANGHGMHFEGCGLDGKLTSRKFDISGNFEIRTNALLPLKAPKAEHTMEVSPFEQSESLPFASALIEPMTPIRLLQNFAGDINSFLKYLDRVEGGNIFGQARPPASLIMTGHHGGHIDLQSVAMQLTGQTALFAPHSLLVSSGGMQLCQESIENETFMHLSGQGGIEAWMHPSGSEETRIHSSTFSYLSDRQVVQFEGGPLMVSRKGTTLVARESWQFIRVFSGNRIVMSPGSWDIPSTITLSAK
jgi:hypothetical protein